MASTKKYISIGNRRDKNLSEVEDKTQALNNLLNDLPGEGDFFSEDLDAIRGLQFENVGASTISTLAGITIKVNDPENPLNLPTPSLPLITIQDRIQKIRNYSGEVPSYFGGLGLDARFIRSSELNVGTAASTGDTIFDFNNLQVIEKNYWEYGYFQHGSLLDNSFSDQYGGIQWTGYFSPYVFDPAPRLNLSTTGLVMVEYDPFETNVWVKVLNIYAKTRTITATATNNNTNVINIDANDSIKVSVGDKLLINSNITITGISATTITLSGNLNVVINDVIAFTKDLGRDLTSNSIILPPKEPGDFIKIRISYWYPNVNDIIENKIFNMDYFSRQSYITFTSLYSEKPAPVPGPDEIKTFLSKYISPYNNQMGNVGVSGSNYRDIYTGRTYLNEYNPKKTLGNISINDPGIRKIGPITINYTAGSNIVSSVGIGEASVIGDYIIPVSTVGNILPKYVQIKNILNDDLVITTHTFNTAGSIQVNVIDHTGFIDWEFATSVGDTVTVSDVSKIRANNVVISSNHSTYIRIASVNPTTTSFTTANTSGPTNLGLTGTQPVYIYSDKGITDDSKLVFCSGVFGAILTTVANPGNTMIFANPAGIAIGQVVQYSDFIAPSTTVTNVVGTTVSLSGTTPITKQILNGATIVFAPSGTSVNKEICVLPLDTSPPFIPTPIGLSTFNKGLRSSPVLTQDFTMSTANLVLTIPSSNVITVASGSLQYNRKIRLNNNQYFIIATT
ncbi:MAG: hypothetical protein [Caudoviricetes sp.]|nr:MAG: hypothetical protein [Caudoviricetes sp.]